MNSGSSRIVYECVSQRDLSSIWPDESPLRAALRSSQQSIGPGTPQLHVGEGFDEAVRSRRGISRMTSLMTTLWKSPRYYRWLLTIASSLMFACFMGFFNSFGVLYMCLRRDLQSSATETGWVASLAWALVLLSPLITAIYQRLGPRLITVVGVILCFVGLFASTYVEEAWVLFITIGLLFGVGINFVFVSTINVVIAYFESHECAMPTTLPGVGATTGVLIFCPVMEIVFDRFGWRSSLRVISSVILVCGLACSSLYRLPPLPPQDRSPEATPNPDEDRLRKLHAKELALRRKKEKLRKSKDNYKLLLKDPMHWIFGLATLISSMVLLCNAINLVEIMTLAGYSNERSALYMSILGFVDTGARLVVAFVGDRLPCSRILIIPAVCLANAGVTFMLTVTTQAAAMITYVTVVGIARAILYSIIYAASVETFGHAVHQESFAFILLMTGLGCLLAPIIPGLSFDLTGTYKYANYCFSVLWLVACAKYLAVYFMKNYRNKMQFAAQTLEQSSAAVAEEEGCLDAESAREAKREEAESSSGHPLGQGPEPPPSPPPSPPPPEYSEVWAFPPKEPPKYAVIDKVTVV
ncbi:monocarboxylate transporter 2-like [Diadema antillarum]|uniref:monocarboxylate transporter 2-like n=1 Tax=Diadema antillarum TaxID=105358 RepID=UPI003A8678EE